MYSSAWITVSLLMNVSPRNIQRTDEKAARLAHDLTDVFKDGHRIGIGPIMDDMSNLIAQLRVKSDV